MSTSGDLTKFDNEILRISEKDSGYLLSKDVRNAGIPHPYLTDFLVRHPEFVRQERGVYVNEFIVEPDMYYILALHKNVIFSHLTALFLHGSSSKEEKGIMDVTFPHGYNRERIQGRNNGENMFIEGSNLRIYSVARKEFDKGVTEVITPRGHRVTAYCKERAVCELISNKKEYDISYYASGIKGYFTGPEIDILQLQEYATMFNVREQVVEYMELLR